MAEDAVRQRLLENIHRLQPKYREAQKALATIDLSTMLDGLWNKLDAYQPGDSPEKAIYMVAACRTFLEPYARSYSAIRNYEEAQRKLDEYDRERSLQDG